MTEQLDLAETRLPFVNMNDEETETTMLTVMAEAEKARAELKDIGVAAGFIGTRQLLERQITAADAKAKALAIENDFRKQIRIRETGITQLAERKALGARRRALEAWTDSLNQAKARAEAEGGAVAEYERVMRATWAIDSIRALPETPSRAEIEPHLADLKERAPKPKGAWK